MNFQQSDAIILRMHAWSETSLIGTAFTREFGKVSLVAKGARRPKSPFENSLDLMSFSRVVFISKASDSPSTLTESRLVKRFQIVDRELLRLYAAYYLVELLEKCTEVGLFEPAMLAQGRDYSIEDLDARRLSAVMEGPPRSIKTGILASVAQSSQTELFDLANDTLRSLECKDCDVRAIVLRLELQFLRLTGHLPSFRNCVHCGVGIVSDRQIIYSPIAGGCVCRTCSVTGRYLMQVPLAVCQYLEGFSVDLWKTIPLQAYISQHRALIRAMMNRTIAGLIDQRPRLHTYLEELGR